MHSFFVSNFYLFSLTNLKLIAQIGSLYSQDILDKIQRRVFINSNSPVIEVEPAFVQTVMKNKSKTLIEIFVTNKSLYELEVFGETKSLTKTVSGDNMINSVEVNCFPKKLFILQDQTKTLLLEIEPKKNLPDENLMLVFSLQFSKVKNDEKVKYFVFCELMTNQMVVVQRSEEEERTKLMTMITYIPRYVLNYYNDIHQRNKFESMNSSGTLTSILLKPKNEDSISPKKPSLAEFDSSILFIDISGFTALNEKLGKLIYSLFFVHLFGFQK